MGVDGWCGYSVYRRKTVLEFKGKAYRPECPFHMCGEDTSLFKVQITAEPPWVLVSGDPVMVNDYQYTIIDWLPIDRSKNEYYLFVSGESFLQFAQKYVDGYLNAELPCLNTVMDWMTDAPVDYYTYECEVDDRVANWEVLMEDTLRFSLRELMQDLIAYHRQIVFACTNPRSDGAYRLRLTCDLPIAYSVRPTDEPHVYDHIIEVAIVADPGKKCSRPDWIAE